MSAGRFRLLGKLPSLSALQAWWDHNWRQADQSLASLEDGTTGAVLLSGSADGTQNITQPINNELGLSITNSDGAGTGARALLRVMADVASAFFAAHGSARTVARCGITLGGWNEILVASSGLLINTSNTGPIVFGTNNVERLRLDASGNAILATVGGGLRIKEGSNARMGRATLVAGGVVVNNTSVTANTEIFLTTQIPGGTGGTLYVAARTAGTSFTVNSTSGLDTSTFAYLLVEPS